MKTAESSIRENGEKKRRLRLGDDEEDHGSRSSEGEEDRLSSLPEVLLVEILSLLPIESAAATSVLSQRWRHLWTQLIRLRFTPDDSAMWRRFDHPTVVYKLSPIIDHIFRQLTSPTIHSFHLRFQSIPRGRYVPYVESWIRQICARNVEEIKVFPIKCNCFIPLPSCVFETESLRVLELQRLFKYNLPDNGIIKLPNLKKLSLILDDLDHELMRLLFKSCPLLQDLCLYLRFMVDDHFVDISSQNLKRLTIDGDLSEGSQFRIDAPQLEHFTVTTDSLSSYCFVRDLSGLLKAKISVETDVSDNLDQISELVRGISSVRSLTLTNFLFNFVNYLHNRVVPIFQNLTHLEMNVFDPHGWNGLMRFLQSSSNLEVLVLSHDRVGDGYCYTQSMDWTIPNSVPVCLLNKLKRMEISSLEQCQKDLDFLRYILSHANVLEQLILFDFSYLGLGGQCEELEFCENLFNCRRSSVACEIEVHGIYRNASNKDFNQLT